MIVGFFTQSPAQLSSGSFCTPRKRNMDILISFKLYAFVTMIEDEKQ